LARSQRQPSQRQRSHRHRSCPRSRQVWPRPVRPVPRRCRRARLRPHSHRLCSAHCRSCQRHRQAL